MKLENGRPENTEVRLEKEIRVYDFLDKLGVEYQRVDHEAAMTMEACEEIDRTLGDGTAICKNLFLCNRQETDFYLLLMPGDKPFKTKNLSAQIGSATCSLSVICSKYLRSIVSLLIITDSFPIVFILIRSFPRNALSGRGTLS